MNAIEMLAKLIGFDTTTRLSNIPLIEFVETYLDEFDVPHIRVEDRKSVV